MKIKDAQINKLKELIIFRDEVLDEAREILGSGGASKIQDHRIAPIEDIIYENQIIIRDRDGQGSRLTQGISPNRNYGSNAQQRKPAMNRMFAGNNNYVDRAERID